MEIASDSMTTNGWKNQSAAYVPPVRVSERKPSVSLSRRKSATTFERQRRAMSTEQIRLADFEEWCDWLDGKLDCQEFGIQLKDSPKYLEGFREQYELEQRNGPEAAIRTTGY